MMDNLYSAAFETYEGPLTEVLQSAIEEIKTYFALDNVRTLKVDDYSIAIPVTFQVSLPPMGAVGGVDIRPTEPCLVKINLKGYPQDSPQVISDRKDFPRKFLGHMYVSRNENLKGGFCLVRNNPDEWFADRTMSDLLSVAGQWLFKAATGLLNEDGDEFDPLRLEGYDQYHVYKYELVSEIVANDQRFLPQYPFALLFSCYYKDRGKDYHKSISAIPFVQLEGMREVIKELNNGKDILTLISIVVWREDGDVESEYCTELPDNFQSLVNYFNARGIDINQVLSCYLGANLNYAIYVPIIHAIKRPKKVIGYDGPYEFVNFLLNLREFTVKKFDPEAMVLNLSHIEPFSAEMAYKLTGEKRDDRQLYIGGGSLGSKMYLHEVRSGNTTVGVCDPDTLLQHNLVRHALFNNHVGINKAKALTKEAKAFFLLNATSGLKEYPYAVHKVDDEDLEKYDWFIDTSAGNNVLNWLTAKAFKEGAQIARCELVHKGELGLLYIEGVGRNPRVDDLVNLTYFLATKNKYLRAWRVYDAQTERLNLSVGLGCSSTTTIMSDDSVSFHASIFSKVLYKEKKREWSKGHGLLYRSIMNEQNGLPETSSEFEIVKPFEVYSCNNSSGWEIRFMNGMTDHFLKFCRSKNVETGGILIGIANYKSKVIHVFDIVSEPRGSKGTCVGFTRGIDGLPEQVNEIKRQTGQIIGYVGEWHTHPMNLEWLSSTDHDTIKKLQKINRRVPIPTLALIVTNVKVLPYVFP